MKNILLILFVSMLLFSCNGIRGIQKHHNTANDILTENLDSIYQNDAIKGFSVSIVNDEGLIYDNGIGFADIEHNQAYSSSTTQPIASISKTLIGISLLKAQQLGKLNLDDPFLMFLVVIFTPPICFPKKNHAICNT